MVMPLRVWRSFCKAINCSCTKTFREPADHLVVYLAVMADWCTEVATITEPVEIQRQIAEQHEFLTDALLPWLEDWQSVWIMCLILVLAFIRPWGSFY
ncbi:hypothetical protein OURE66S_03979 [Oligella ureolytica]